MKGHLARFGRGVYGKTIMGRMPMIRWLQHFLIATRRFRLMKFIFVLILSASIISPVIAEQSWPMTVATNGYKVNLYRPQPEALSNGVLHARFALGVIQPLTNEVVYGTGYFNALTSNDVAISVILLRDIHVVKVELPGMDGQEVHKLTCCLAQEALGWELKIPEAVVKSALALADQERARNQPAPQVVFAPRDASLVVEYDGIPRFVPIEQTSLHYADNSAFQVIQDGDSFYCAERGVWFVSDHPQGPWRTADHVPDKFKRIPPSSPVHNTRFLYVGTQDADAVQFRFYPEYLRAPRRWNRLHAWAVDYESSDYFIRTDPYAGSIYYRDKSSVHPETRTKNWGRDVSKFPEIK